MSITIITIFTLLYLLPFQHIYSKDECFKKDFIVAIDIGHTPKIAGATSARGIKEYVFNRTIAEKLYYQLTQQGFTHVLLINQKGDNISLTERAERANERKAQLFISIHHDSVQPHYLSSWTYQDKDLAYSDKFQGYSIFYSEKNKKPEKSLEFALLLGSVLHTNGFVPTLHHAEKIDGENRELVDKDKGVYRFDDLVVLKKTHMAAILLECGVIVNRSEEVLLLNPGYQKKIVHSITDALITASCQ